jgi:hypothetical protein
LKEELIEIQVEKEKELDKRDIAASQILSMAVLGFNVSDCLRFSSPSDPRNACQVERSSPKIQPGTLL